VFNANVFCQAKNLKPITYKLMCGIIKNMISRVSGIVVHKENDYAILDVVGVGYKVHMTQSFLSSLKDEAECVAWTRLVSRETTLELYGFETRKDLVFFEKLIEVSGIGPKSALGVLHIASVEQLERAIGAGDTSYLTKVSGIGKKTAAKIVLELKDKVDVVEGAHDPNILKEEADVLEALQALGYSAREVREVLGQVEKKEMPANEKIKTALKILGQ
jgi:holliday junction DNA helicase RuvA